MALLGETRFSYRVRTSSSVLLRSQLAVAMPSALSAKQPTTAENRENSRENLA
jgi:hypothetical protein